MEIFFVVLALCLFALLAYIIYFVSSPMPIVRLLRKQRGEPASLPQDWENAKDNIDITRDLQYASACPRNTYDLFLPKGDKKCPLVLWVHGGAFVAGDKSGTENWAVMLAENGYAVASINYCHAPEAVYPSQIRQVEEALRELLTYSKIDENSVIIAGDSAGAYIAVQFALCHINEKLSKKLGVVSPLSGTALQCLLLFCGPYDVKRVLDQKDKVLRLFISRIGWSFFGKKNWKKAELISTVTPMDFVTEKMPPCYITDGNTMSFESHGRELAAALRDKGVFVKERYFPKEEYGEVQHEYQMKLDTENGKLCFNEALAFIKDCKNKNNQPS